MLAFMSQDSKLQFFIFLNPTNKQSYFSGLVSSAK